MIAQRSARPRLTLFYLKNNHFKIQSLGITINTKFALNDLSRRGLDTLGLQHAFCGQSF